MTAPKLARIAIADDRGKAGPESPGAAVRPEVRSRKSEIKSRVGFYAPRPAGTLKSAQADLVERAGGLDRAADIGGKSRSQIARYTDPGERHHMPADVVRRLESAVGDPVVSRFLAAEQSCVLVPVAGAEGGDEIALDVITVGEDFGVLCRDYHDAMLNPRSRNVVDAREAGRLVVDIDRMMGHLAAMRGHAVAKRDASQKPAAGNQKSEGGR